MSKNVEKAKKAFLLMQKDPSLKPDSIISYSRQATACRGDLYCPNTKDSSTKKEFDSQKKEFWSFYSNFVGAILTEYKSGNVTENRHVDILERLIEKASKDQHKILKEGKLRFGSAQKLFNLTLKYYWVKGTIKEPPHLPVDALIAANVRERKYRWTQNNSKTDYLAIIERCKIASRTHGFKSLSEWELVIWNLVSSPSRAKCPSR